MAFPWTNLITAAAALSGALGGVSLTALLGARAEERRFAHERRMRQDTQRADAYANFLQVTHADARMLAIALTRLTGGSDATAAIEDLRALVVEFNSSLAQVEIAGTEAGVLAARNVADQATHVGRLCTQVHEQGEHLDPVAADAAHGTLRDSIGAFSDRCRKELTD